MTEILQVIAKPQLEKWKRDQVALAALTIPRMPDEHSEELLRRIDADASRQAQEAALAGGAVHDAIEASFRSEPVPWNYVATVEAVRSKLAELYPKVTDWVAEKSFAHPKGFAGRCDLHSPSTGIVIDWKGKDGDFSDGKKLAWDQHWQMSAYQVGLGLPFAPAANIFFSRTHPGAVSAHIWEPPDMERGWSVFEAALTLHKAIKNYDASWS